MLNIRKGQLDVIDQAVEEAYAREMARYLQAEHAEDVAGLSDEDLYARVNVAIRRATRLGLTWDESITAFVAMMFAVAPTFDEQPAIAAVLKDERIAPNLRIDALWDRTSDEDWEEAAERAEQAESFWTRALLELPGAGR